MARVKPPIIILHGWGVGSVSWQAVKKLLEEDGFLVCSPDLPGFGNNKAPLSPWAIDDYVFWTKEFVEKNQFKEVYLVGHSFGGRVAIKFAGQYPEKIKALVLIAAAGIKTEFGLKERLARLLAGIGRKLAFIPFWRFFRRIFYYYFLRKRDYFKATGTMKKTFKLVVGEDITPFLKEIKSPTLLLWGKKDKLTPLKDGKMMNREIKNSVLKIIANKGHNLNSQAPEELAFLIASFLKQ